MTYVRQQRRLHMHQGPKNVKLNIYFATRTPTWNRHGQLMQPTKSVVLQHLGSLALDKQMAQHLGVQAELTKVHCTRLGTMLACMANRLCMMLRHDSALAVSGYSCQDNSRSCGLQVA